MLKINFNHESHTLYGVLGFETSDEMINVISTEPKGDMAYAAALCASLLAPNDKIAEDNVLFGMLLNTLDPEVNFDVPSKVVEYLYLNTPTAEQRDKMKHFMIGYAMMRDPKGMEHAKAKAAEFFSKTAGVGTND